METNENQPRIGIALGSGSSRGWSHIGVIKVLSEIGIEPDIVCGCSVGALVGASYAAGNLDKLEEWVTSLTKFKVAKFFELNLSLTGFVNTDRLRAFLTRHVCAEELTIEDLPKKFATVSTDLDTGREIWFTKGPVLSAVWASMSLPGLFPPIRHQGRWLIDGGLVNPVPVSICRALGADIVIAVNLNGDILRKNLLRRQPPEKSEGSIISILAETAREYSSAIFPRFKSKQATPGLLDAMAGSINIMQDRITRSRMAGDPPDILIAPKLSHIGLLEFFRAKEAIQEGEKCVRRMLPDIRYILGLD